MTASGLPQNTEYTHRIAAAPGKTDHILPADAPVRPKPKLLDQLREALRSRHYSYRTEQSYCHWVKRFIVTMLPGSLKRPLQDHLRKIKAVHEKDLAEGRGRVQLPDALDRKYPNAPTDWRWQWVFPQENRWRNAKTEEEGRHHVDESILQKAFKQAVGKAGIVRRAACHTLQAFFCHASLGEWIRHPYGPGTAGAQRCTNDHDLYACSEPGRSQSAQPGGQLIGRGRCVLCGNHIRRRN